MFTLILLMVRSKSLSSPQVFSEVCCSHSLVSWGFGDEADGWKFHTGAERGWQTAGCNGDLAQARSRTGSEKRLELDAFVGGDIKRPLHFLLYGVLGFK